eukprot:scaffold1338_cov121-Cylindrotheca_fusiformis.AAC.5
MSCLCHNSTRGPPSFRSVVPRRARLTATSNDSRMYSKFSTFYPTVGCAGSNHSDHPLVRGQPRERLVVSHDSFRTAWIAERQTAPRPHQPKQNPI